MQSLEQSWIFLSERIKQALRHTGRSPESVTLLAVTKTVPVEKIEAAYQLGQRHFAENYIQEALEKQLILRERCPEIVWHFIGSIQRRKVAQIAEHFSWVHGIDRAELIERLHAARSPTLPPLNICLQVNISGEDTKHGFLPDVKVLQDVLEPARALNRLSWRGLMGMAAPGLIEEEQHAQFRRLAVVHNQLKSMMGTQWDVLSMGMSADMEAAIAEGATHVRIGTALFGAREKIIAF